LTYIYTPSLLKKVVGKYIGIDDLYTERELGLFEFTSSMLSQANCVVENPDSNLNFIKNGN
jgi:hypothetical protein